MKRREKIILGLMALVIAYGFYALFFSSPHKKTDIYAGKKSEELSRIITEISLDLSKSGPTEEDNYVIARAKSDWVKDPFLEKKASVTKEIQKPKEPEVVIPKFTFAYSGFMKMGELKIAIVNGLEYKIGEEVVPDKCVIREIYPNKVIIRIKGIKGKKGEIIVPLVEEVL